MKRIRVALCLLAGGLLGACTTSNQAGSDYIEDTLGINMEMVYVQGGDFMMGGTAEQGEDAGEEEFPVHRVNVSPYYMGRFEVTQGQWEKVMGSTVRQQRAKIDSSWFLPGEDPDLPVYYVDYEEATIFCKELSRLSGKNYALPTEAQWEYAARGGNKAKEQTKYSGNDTAYQVAWFSENSEAGTHPVGSKQANALGIYDMSGNVWEWCSDIYGVYSDKKQTDPKGAGEGSNHVVRGGGWYTDVEYTRVSCRYGDSVHGRYANLGFRVVMLP